MGGLSGSTAAQAEYHAALRPVLDQRKTDAGGEAMPPTPEETVRLLGLIRMGDTSALDNLLARILPRLRRWAHGRLPQASRGMLDTGDIVQTVAARAARLFAGLDVTASADLTYYLREAVRNEIASQWRKADRTPRETTLGESLPADVTSPVELLLGAERMRRYERALAALPAPARTAIIGYYELGYSHEELARVLGVASAATARVRLHRAVKLLIEQVTRA